MSEHNYAYTYRYIDLKIIFTLHIISVVIVMSVLIAVIRKQALVDVVLSSALNWLNAINIISQCNTVSLSLILNA